MTRNVPGQSGNPGSMGRSGPPPVGAARDGHADGVSSLLVRQPLVLVVGPAGPGRSAALAILAGPAAGGTMIDLGALWMAVDPPADRPRTVRLNGAPSAAGRRGWEAIAGAIGAVAAPPAVVLVDTFRGLSAALGGAGAAETVSALVAPGRTLVLVLDDLAEAEAFGALALRHGAVVSVDEQAIRGVRTVADLVGEVREAPPRRAWTEAAAALAEPVPIGGSEPEPREAEPPAGDRRRWWWRRAEPTPENSREATGPPSAAPPTAGGCASELPEPGFAAPGPRGPVADLPVRAGPAVSVSVAVVDTGGAPVSRPLTPGGYYLIQIAMRAAPDGSSALLPDDLRIEPPGEIGAWMQLSAVAESVPVPPGPHSIFVPRHGLAWTCPCSPDGPHSCLRQERSERLELPFVAPRRSDVYRVHLAVRHRSTVIHQTRLELPVSGPGVAPNPAGPTAIVTYQAARD